MLFLNTLLLWVFRLRKGISEVYSALLVLVLVLSLGFLSYSITSKNVKLHVEGLNEALNRASLNTNSKLTFISKFKLDSKIAILLYNYGQNVTIKRVMLDSRVIQPNVYVYLKGQGWSLQNFVPSKTLLVIVLDSNVSSSRIIVEFEDDTYEVIGF